MPNKLIIGSEKALLAALTGGTGSLGVQLSQTNGQVTLREVLSSLAIAVLTYAITWLTTNTPELPTQVVPPVFTPDPVMTGVPEVASEPVELPQTAPVASPPAVETAETPTA